MPRYLFALIGVLLALLCVAKEVTAQENAKTVLAWYEGERDGSSLQLIDRGIDATLRNALGSLSQHLPSIPISRDWCPKLSGPAASVRSFEGR